MGLFSTILGIGGSLLGGIIGNDAEEDRQNAANAYNDPSAIRSRFEAAGFNPLLGINNPSALQQNVRGGSQMGSAVANAAMFAAESLEREEELKIEKSRLEMDRRELDHKLQNATIRPRTGGLYARTVTAPSLGGVGTSAAKAAAAATVGNLQTDDGSPAVVTKVGNLTHQEELNRLDVGEGGQIGESSIHVRKMPFGLPDYHTAYPAMGQRLEDEQGEFLSVPSLLSYVAEDIGNNVMGRSFNAGTQEWEKSDYEKRKIARIKGEDTRHPTTKYNHWRFAMKRREQFENSPIGGFFSKSQLAKDRRSRGY